MTAPSRATEATRLARVARELLALSEGIDLGQVDDMWSLVHATMLLERDLAQVRAALTGGAR